VWYANFLDPSKGGDKILPSSMNLLSYLMRISGRSSLAQTVLFLTDWQHVVNTGLQATKLSWDRCFGTISSEGEDDTRIRGSVWEAAEHVLEAIDGRSNTEVLQLMRTSYPMLTTEPVGSLDLPRLGWDYQSDIRQLRNRRQSQPPTRYERLMS